MDENERKMYSEVYSILQLLENKYIEMLPKKLYKIIDDNRDKKYKPNYDGSADLENQNISKEAKAFLILISLKYWMKDEKEKDDFWKHIKKKS